MIDYCHGRQRPITRCGGEQFGDQRPHAFYLSVKSDIIRQFSSDYSENFPYTDFRTNVCVYKGVRIMKDQKEKFTKLMDKLCEKLSAKQIEYLYYLACKLFGHAPD